MRALVVEDEPYVASLVVRLLARRGIEPALAKSRAEAFVVVAQPDARFDLAYIDLGLPDGSGLDILVEMRRQGREPPAILATGQIGELHVDAHVIVRKPFTLDVFDEAIDLCLATPVGDA
jgi:DNA-binding response OmpR family regulator